MYSESAKHNKSITMRSAKLLRTINHNIYLIVAISSIAFCSADSACLALSSAALHR